MTLGYDLPVTGTTVDGRGNPESQGALSPRHALSRLFSAYRLCTPMAAPSGASFGWAGSLCPVFHPRPAAAALSLKQRGDGPWSGS